MSEISIEHAGRHSKISVTSEELKALKNAVASELLKIPSGPTGERTAEGNVKAERLMKLDGFLDEVLQNKD